MSTFLLRPIDGAAIGAEELAAVSLRRAAPSPQLDALAEALLQDSERLGVDAAGAHGGRRGERSEDGAIARGAETPRKADARRRRAAGAAGAAAAVASDMTGIGEEVEWIKARATRTRASTRRRVRGGGRSARFVRNARSGDGRSRARGRRGRGCVWPRSRRERKGADSSRGLPEETNPRDKT